MKMIYYMLVCLALVVLPGVAAEHDTVGIRIQVIAADQEAGPSDAALSGLLPKLQRMPYKRFMQAGTRVVTLSVGQAVRTEIGGHTMNLMLESVQDGRARVHVTWIRGRTSVANITAVTQPGSPFVCGGPREGSRTWIAVFSVQ